MSMLPQSLTARLVAGAAVFILLALLATGVAVQFALHRFVQGQIDQRLDAQLLTIEAALEARPDGTVRLVRNVDGPPFDEPRTGWFWIARAPGDVWRSASLGSDDLPRPPPAHRDADRPRTAEGPGPHGAPVRLRARTVVIGASAVTIAAAAPLAALAGPMRDALVPLATALLVLGAGLIAATLLQVRLGLRPLQRLQGLLADVRTGRAARLPAEQPREIRPLVAELNNLLDQNAASLERARRHVANLAHSLKTPLATLALALDRPGREADTSLLPLVDAMDRRIRHHLTRARAAALGAPARGRVPLAPRVADHLTAFAKIYAAKGIVCRVDLRSDIGVACEPQDLDEMLGNVLDNAFKWAESAIRMHGAVVAQFVEIVIEDDGPGLSSEQMPSVLRPGQRLDESAPGHGFGLSITQELAELYGGGVRLDASPLGGLRVTLRLPAAT